MNVVRKPADLVAEARGILNRARWDMSGTLSQRVRHSIDDRAAERVEQLIALAQAPALLRDATWEQRRGRRPSPSRYRVELS